jgi:L-aminopeptidase/D-esterase-like protein
VIAAALRGGSGATVKAVNLSPKMGRTDVIRAMTSAGTDRSLLLVGAGVEDGHLRRHWSGL